MAEQALALVDQQVNTDVLARSSAFRTLAWQAKWRGDFDSTAKFCTKAKQRVDRMTARHVLVDVYSLLGVVHYSAGRRDFAARMVQRGFDILDDTVPAEAHVDLYTTHATILRYRERMGEAKDALQTALELAVGAERARVEHNIARAINHDGNFSEGLERAENALSLARRYGNRVLLPYALEVLSTSLTGLDREREALTFLEEGLAVALADDDRRAECQLLKQLGVAQRNLGFEDDACKTLQRGRAIAQEMGYPLWHQSFALCLAELYEKRADFKAAAEAYKAVVNLMRATRD